jgi:hypothetical protein
VKRVQLVPEAAGWTAGLELTCPSRPLGEAIEQRTGQRNITEQPERDGGGLEGA